MADFFINLSVTILIGIAVGLERQLNSKVIGVRTITLLLLGAFMFTYISTAIAGSDPARVVAQVVTGVGFIGGGIIFKEGIKDIHNLTTAVLIWTMSAIGCMTCLGFILESCVITVIILILLTMNKYLHFNNDNNNEHENNKNN